MRHIELFTTAADVKILPEPHGQRLSNQKNKNGAEKFRAVRDS
jgi:hypothetical protein